MKKIQNISGIIYIVLGLFMVLKPVSVSNVICYIIGGVIAVFGTSFLINYFKTPDSAGGKAILVISLIMIMLGAYIIFNPTTFASIIPLITGVFVLVDALNKIRMALQLKSLNSANWIQVLISGVIMLILGGVLIFSPFSAIEIAIRVIGIILIIGGGSDIYASFCFDKTNTVMEAKIVKK